MDRLAKSGLTSEMEQAAQRLSLAQSEKDLEAATKNLARQRIARQNLVTERIRQRMAERSAADDLTIRISALQQPLSTSPNGLLEIRAPYDAICAEVAQQNSGAVVAPGSELCQLSPVSGRLQARLDIPESGLSRLEAKQPTRMLFDAFPYQRFGIVTGTIDWISPAAITRAQGSEFVALASLDRSEIKAGGKSYPLKAGMKGQARVVVGRRALIEYVFEPLRSMRENLR